MITLLTILGCIVILAILIVALGLSFIMTFWKPLLFILIVLFLLSLFFNGGK